MHVYMYIVFCFLYIYFCINFEKSTVVRLYIYKILNTVMIIIFDIFTIYIQLIFIIYNIITVCMSIYIYRYISVPTVYRYIR